MAGDTQPPDVEVSGGRDPEDGSNTGDTPPPASNERTDEGTPKPLPRQPVGTLTIFVFEIVYLLLGGISVYALWALWPFEGRGDYVNFFRWAFTLPADSDARMMLVAGTAGMLGAFVHAVTSFTSYAGNRKLYRSWLPWYVLRPVIGLSVGVLFYLVFRGGFITTAGAENVDPFGIAVVSGLAGLFSKQAIDKLNEIFEVAVRPRDDMRADKLKGNDTGEQAHPPVDSAGNPPPGKRDDVSE